MFAWQKLVESHANKILKNWRTHRKIETRKVQVDMTVKSSEMLRYADITVNFAIQRKKAFSAAKQKL